MKIPAVAPSLPEIAPQTVYSVFPVVRGSTSAMPFRRDISLDQPVRTGQTGNYADHLEVDVLIVGAGFGGVYLLHKLRDEYGMNVKIVEAGKDLGGIWHWNCYPGARVDSMVPVYEYSIEKLWKNWTWTEKYPGYAELREYFAFVDQHLDIKKDVAFDSKVVRAQFDKPSQRWTVKLEDGRTAHSKFFISATGFAAKRYFPDWPGLEKFKGVMHHSSFWPGEGVDVTGKRVAVVGTGCTGLQIAQETAKTAESVTVFQRTPNIALPMRQEKLTKEAQAAQKKDYPEIYRYRMQTASGFPAEPVDRNALDDTPEQREELYEELWQKGGFYFLLGGYKDLMLDESANDDAYKFWARKTRARITDPVKRELLAPLEKPHPLGSKRASLEQDYYEVVDRPENELVDVRKTPIVEVTEKGLKTADGREREFDVIALATGFDSLTGGMKDMGLKDVNGVDLSEKWKNGTYTYLGMTLSGFPNLFFLYGAHGPTAFSNGPSCIECQADWIIDAIAKMRKEGINCIEPTMASEQEWHDKVETISKNTLYHNTDSWYMGTNIPGKPREQLNYAGGIPQYTRECREVLDNGFEGFVTA
ncbi:FAD/NAD(P)-binding domain-containing protein [Punctularia strigosozonata HHB-11173 SS5]|uniref:FAD/NAD(P)-binding domain-containing protein n=1 Tax=Punctularia strigosozonata (strain HHB-11173) TaxID=741275 RepID=R7S424_PUNST|nr:FAD/NAD(P)-binding domain-containing protein [Punctularia strigosozonata HHB-11173 SS5]EIN04547.1 FAD/NAD(P)-binding domain-containing protein [Punctularia strigosozonata HHB-11173 SS5]